MRTSSTLVGLPGASLAGMAGAAAAQTVDLATPVETPAPETVEAGSSMSPTVGLGAAVAPDHEGSDDNTFVPCETAARQPLLRTARSSTVVARPISCLGEFY